MPEDQEKNGGSAGTSSETIRVEDVFERLKQEVRGRPPVSMDGSGEPPAARAEAERLWPVAVDVPIERRRGLRGRFAYPVKRILRKLMSWYVGPFVADQRNFNAASLRLADELREYVDQRRVQEDERVARAEEAFAGLERRVVDWSRMLAELEERLLRLERHQRAASPAVQDTGKAFAQAPDYFAFEARMRGSTAEVRDHQRPYVEDFRECGPVLDIGCGRGEFLELLAESGIEARGIDTDSDMVAFCRGEALDVEQHDAIAYLTALEDDALGGIFCAHVLEHLLPPVLLRLLELAKAKLRPDGLFAAETPNPRTLVSLSTFFADLTHAQPLHPETLAYLAGQAGLRHVEIRYLNPPPAEGRLRSVPLPEARELQAASETLNANVERLNEVIFGPQDFAVLARA